MPSMGARFLGPATGRMRRRRAHTWMEKAESRHNERWRPSGFSIQVGVAADLAPCSLLASNPGFHPAFRRLQYKKRGTASDEKLDESLGLRLIVYRMDSCN